MGPGWEQIRCVGLPKQVGCFTSFIRRSAGWEAGHIDFDKSPDITQVTLYVESINPAYTLLLQTEELSHSTPFGMVVTTGNRDYMLRLISPEVCIAHFLQWWTSISRMAGCWSSKYYITSLWLNSISSEWTPSRTLTLCFSVYVLPSVGDRGGLAGKVVKRQLGQWSCHVFPYLRFRNLRRWLACKRKTRGRVGMLESWIWWSPL